LIFPLQDQSGLAMQGGISFDITDRIKAEQDLQETSRQYRRLVEGTNALLFTTDVKGRITYANEAATRALGLSASEVVGQFYLRFVDPEDRKRVHEVFKMLLTGQTVPSYEEFRYRVSEERKGWFSFSVNPLIVDGHISGLTGIAQEITRRKETEARLEEAHLRLQALSKRLLNAQETERRSIARDLHDELGQELTVIKMLLTALQKGLRKTQDETLMVDLEKRVTSLLDVSDRAIHTVRRIATDLRPDVLDKLGLLDALRWLTHEFQLRTGIESYAFFSYVEKLRFSDDIATAVFRICQEAMTNVARHSGASKVSIEFTAADGVAQCTIRDNGHGMTDKQELEFGSLGLQGMRERASLIGGEVQVLSNSESGTTVTLRFPIQQGEQ
jgi:PAS domain S-box-containing protein